MTNSITAFPEGSLGKYATTKKNEKSVQKNTQSPIHNAAEDGVTFIRNTQSRQEALQDNAFFEDKVIDEMTRALEIGEFAKVRELGRKVISHQDAPQLAKQKSNELILLSIRNEQTLIAANSEAEKGNYACALSYIRALSAAYPHFEQAAHFTRHCMQAIMLQNFIIELYEKGDYESAADLAEGYKLSYRENAFIAGIIARGIIEQSKGLH